MAFETDTFAHTAVANPAAHFKSLTKRQYPDVMPHQKEMLENEVMTLEAIIKNLPFASEAMEIVP